METTLTYLLLFTLITFAFRFMLKRRYVDLIGIFILINTLTSITVEFFPEGAFHTGYFRYGIALIIVFYLLIEIKPFKITPIVYLIILYLIFLSLFNSSNISGSLQTAVGIAMSLTMFGIAYKVINNHEDLFKLYRYLTIATIAILLQYVYANVFQIGRSPYLGDFFYTGGASVGAMTMLAIYVLFTPIVISIQKKISIYQIILISLSVIMILLLFRRGALLGLLTGVIILALYNYRYKYTLHLAVFAMLGIGIALYFVGDRITEIYEVRADTTEYVEGAAGRVLEVSWVNDSFERHDTYKLFTGIETFNSADYFSRTIGRQRSLHTDYMSLLHGTGLIGIILFFIFYVNLFKYKNRVPKLFRGIYVSIFFASLVISYSGLILGISNYSYLLIVLGTILGVGKNIDSENGRANSNK